VPKDKTNNERKTKVFSKAFFNRSHPVDTHRFVSACGGGSLGNASSDAATANLSASQAAYENMTIAANGGLHYLIGSLTFTTSSSGSASLDSSSVFFSENSSIPQSAANGAQPVTVTETSVASTLAAPTSSGVNRYLINGSVVTVPVPERPLVSYVGQNILENYLATDGKTIVHSFLGTSYTFVPLSGLIANSPAELLDNSNLGLLTNVINGQSLYNPLAVWQAGSGYLKVVRQTSGDTLAVGDCNSPVTTGTSVTPCSTAVSTLEAFFPVTKPGRQQELSIQRRPDCHARRRARVGCQYAYIGRYYELPCVLPKQWRD
jgi:hypothetical protein